MTRRLRVNSPYPNLRGTYVEKGRSEGTPTFVRDDSQGDGSVTWIFHCTKFGKGPCWYFGESLPVCNSLSSFCRSTDDAPTPDAAQWPTNDITDIKEFVGLPELAVPCSACTDLKTLSEVLTCASCGPAAHASAMRGLSLLRDHASNVARHRLAIAFANGDAEARRRLEIIAVTHQDGSAKPLILAEPRARVDVGASTTALTFEAICFNGAELRYQWSKDDVLLPRAIRPRFVLSGAGPQDEGVYVCQISTGSNFAYTRACEVRLSAIERERLSEETVRRARFESQVFLSATAESLGNVDAAVANISKAIKLAEGNAALRASAFCRRAELLLQSGRLAEAFDDSMEAVNASPGLARAHAVRGAAAVRLGRLAEAASSWETAEFLGGVPEAAREAETCRQRLNSFFEERNAQRMACGDADTRDRINEEGPEHQAGSGGRAAGPSFGRGGGDDGTHRPFSSGSRTSDRFRVSAELQRHLTALGLATDTLPSQDVVCGTYRRLALQAHPDKPGGSKEAFQELQNAYEAVLIAIAM